ncbi:unnamed protein product [Blepharisma stoltei]|uniref:Uncharacterized protein n=1 Tax=Blepharisma stoltei TaxID=1481888 RepID=A0AAU9ITQ5_9CILI|nr:unnamed protein product [Blepharisma stoltei]
MMNDFHSRFKEKVSLMNKNGLLDLKTNYAASKSINKLKVSPSLEPPSPSLPQSPNGSQKLPVIEHKTKNKIFTTLPQIISSSKKQARVRNISPIPIKVKESYQDQEAFFSILRKCKTKKTKVTERINMSPLGSYKVNKSFDSIKLSSNKFSPYTFSEYKNIRQEYITLGGLGPSIGTAEWKVLSSRDRRRKEYAKLLETNPVKKSMDIVENSTRRYASQGRKSRIRQQEELNNNFV